MSVPDRVGATIVVLLLIIPSTLLAAGDDAGPLADETTRFTDVTTEAGIPGDLARTRVAWGDYNGDGWEDLLLDGSQFFRNNGDGTFRDVTSEAGIRGVASHGGVWADYDNDGDADFYANVRSMRDRDALWRNNGDGTFTDVSEHAGEIYDHLPTEGVAWGDYDDDGFVDLYVANYETASVDPDAELGIGTPDVLYHNRGDGTFENVSEEAGIELDELLCGRGVVWADYDDDGDADIYVSNYRLDPNLLWRNDGDGTFTNVAREARVEGYSTNDPPGGNRYGHSVGSDFGDYDNDGDMDLYVSNLAHPRFIMFSDKSMLMKNRGDGTFVDRFYGSGIDYCETSSDSSWADYDNDGDLDLYFTAVYEDRLSRLFRNVERDRFEDATGESRTAVDNGWGTGWCDYDHDGDLDLAVGSGSAFRLFENGGNENHWIQVTLEGRTCNSMAIGARVRVFAGGIAMVRDVKAGRGTTSQDMLTCHFGLGGYDALVEVDVRWPGDTAWTVYGVYDVDQRVTITEDEVPTDASVHLRVDPAEARLGARVTITSTVRNEGVNPIATFEATLYVQEEGTIDVLMWDVLGPEDEAEFVTYWTPEREGSYTIALELTHVEPADNNPDNDFTYAPLTVAGANEPPTAVLTVDPEEGPPGMSFEFAGWESTDDTGVVRYLFDFGDGTDPAWTTASIVTHAYSMEGEFLASLTVEDEEGEMSSNLATATLTVTSKGYRPTAEILTILPDPVRAGEVATLHGTGYGVAGANITGYSWNSSIDGHLGDEALITTTHLSVGEHTIFFKVRDSRGLWSDPVSALLRVFPQAGNWTVRIDAPVEGANPKEDLLDVSGMVAYTAGPVLLVEVRVDNGPWDEATGTMYWHYEVYLLDLEDGPHTIRVRASSLDSTSDLVMVNFTLGEVPSPEGFDVVEWLTSWRGIVFVVAVAVLVVANVYVTRRRHRASLG